MAQVRAFLIHIKRKLHVLVWTTRVYSVVKKVMLNAKLYLSEAKIWVIKKYKFDFIFIHSVFQYFDSLVMQIKFYTLKPFLRKETKLLDVPNI